MFSQLKLVETCDKGASCAYAKNENKGAAFSAYRFFHADAVRYADILPVVGNDRVARPLIKPNGFGLFLPGFQHASCGVEFARPRFEFHQNLFGNALAAMFRANVHAFDFDCAFSEWFERATTDGLLIQISDDGVLNVINLVELRVKRMVCAVAFA